MTEKNLKIWLLAYIGFGTLFMTIETIAPFDFDWVIKATPLFLLIYFCQVSLTGNIRIFMVLALICSVTGDILLSMDNLFVPGLVAFLLAQVIYTGIFGKAATFSKKGALWGLMVITYMVIAGAFILPKAGDFLIPVTVYMIAISLMSIAAGFRNDPHFMFVAIGAFIFMSSDTFIAINKFVTPFDGARYAIMTTYYAAQLMICFGIVRHHNLIKRQSKNQGLVYTD